MTFSLVICTYMRPKPLLNLLNSVKRQTLYPNEILIIDGSSDTKTKEIIEDYHFKNVKYFLTDSKDRGLTKQRNFGIKRTNEKSDVLCFLDDDVILEHNYFQSLISTYLKFPGAMGVGGYITNEVEWIKGETYTLNFFNYDGWSRLEPLRFKVRKFFGLQPNIGPGFLPEFSHGRSISFFPPSGNIYPVEQLMGGVSSFKRELFGQFKFSEYFEGYGLYEDAEFTLRVSRKFELYVNTNARLAHYHDASGRPNQFKYGQMVARNGWYVWRIKYPKPSFKAKVKWHLTFILLMKLRFLNVFTTKKRVEALTEGCGRFVGWLSLFFYNPIKEYSRKQKSHRFN